MTSKGSFQVIRGHHHFCDYNFRHIQHKDMRPTPMYLSRQDASIHMQHDLLGSPLDLDPRSNFEIDPTRSKSITLDAPWRDKHNGAYYIALTFLYKKLSIKLMFAKKSLFWLWWPLEPKLYIWGKIWELFQIREFKLLSIGVFRLLLSSIVSEISEIVWSKVTKLKILTFGDLWWPQFWPERKKTEIV